MGFLAANAGTIVVGLIVLAVVVLIIMSIRRDKKNGKSTCGGNCAHCAGACHRSEERR